MTHIHGLKFLNGLYSRSKHKIADANLFHTITFSKTNTSIHNCKLHLKLYYEVEQLICIFRIPCHCFFKCKNKAHI